MNVTIVGTGYVGLVTGTCFAEMGNDVVCVDNNVEKIRLLNSGVIPIWEPGLDAMVKRNCAAGRLKFTTDMEDAVKSSRVIFIAVGTPPEEDGSADLQYVLAVAGEIANYMLDYKVIVNKSTVPVGTADIVKQNIRKVLRERNEDLRFDVVSNPEFLKEGAAIDDFMKPDRIVIGADCDEAAKLLKDLYAPYNVSSDRIILMSVRSAEMTKYASNAMLATKISFINEIALICEKVGADVAEVRHGMGSDSRIGYKFLYPGVGYGGSCFPKDVKALVHTAQASGIDPHVLVAVEKRNSLQKSVLYDKVVDHYSKNLSGLVFTVWGLSFKPQTDDMRDAPSRVIMDRMLGSGATLKVYDPVAMHEAKKIIPPTNALIYHDDQYEALHGSDALLLITEWNQFRNPDFDKIKSLMKTPVIFDGRNQYDPAQVKGAGFIYYGIGRL